MIPKPFKRALITAAIATALTGLRAEPTGVEFFEQKIRPVLAEHCFECHSANGKSVKGGLRLDGRDAMLAGGDSGPAVVPGKPGDSLLLKAIGHTHPDLAMPPKKAKLPEAIRQDVARWIADGAVWPEGGAAPAAKKFDLEARKRSQAWLWQSPRPQPIPEVKDAAWSGSPIDRFILARLESKGLSPAASAAPEVWLRRVSFGLTGLPPRREELIEFLADPSTEARERVVDRLLASPQFGERWARHWMDLMRYAESRGHESDYLIANAWHYRDYLIRAFNADVPYPQFLKEHLAGDLLPHPRLRPGTDSNESVLGTGWAFLGEEVHSPVDIRQDECDRLDNKVDVFTKSFLGLTVACARCHDHKFDPISTQDYYALTGFLMGASFRQVRFEAMENNRRMASELDAVRKKRWPGLLKGLGQRMNSQSGRLPLHWIAALGEVMPAVTRDDETLAEWQSAMRAASSDPAHALYPWLARSLELRGEASAIPSLQPVETPGLSPDIRVIADFTRSDYRPWKVDGEAFGARPMGAGEAISSADGLGLGGLMRFGAARRDPFWKRLATAPGNENDSGELGATGRSGQMLRTPTITLKGGRLHYLLRGATRVYAAVDSHLMVAGPLHGQLIGHFDSGPTSAPRWVTHDLSAYSGHRTHIEFGPVGDRPLEVLMVVESPEVPRWLPEGAQSIWVGSEVSTLEEAAKALGWAIVRIGAALERGESVPRNLLPLADLLVRQPALLGPPETAWTTALDDCRRQESAIADGVQWVSRTAVAWMDGTGVDEFVLVRGKPFKPGPVAPRSLPTAFPKARPVTDPFSSGRLELAEQLTDPDNPLVARTLVNRVWHHLLGRGIVPTVDNFGTLGEAPTHPELLDHLAWQFLHEDGGSIKRLIQRIVLTQTYAMGHQAADPRADQIDPANRLWHRMPVRRLEAEAIRDAALQVSGRLDPAVGGPPVPVHLNEFVIGRGRPDNSGPLDGAGRRSVYQGVRRNFLSPTLLTFDTPTPFSTVGRRNVTNVPAQALALMNDPFFHEQAELWARRLLRELPTAEASERIRWM
ncbi:MAG: PSD1 and planctomycete cytochrome C domain-containing protein, partial [Limisphaerales bacterium]